MLMSTLPEVPGLMFEVKGFAYAQGTLGPKGGPQKMVESLVEQARRLGANGIVDLKTVVGGHYANCIMTGTAVLLMQRPPG